MAQRPQQQIGQKQQLPQQMQGQQQQQKVMPEEDTWIYESLIQYLQSPVYKVPIYDFFDENCIAFEDLNKIGNDHKQIHDTYREVVNNLVYILSQDITVESAKIFSLIELGLNIEGHAKVFWSFRIYYHFNDFVKFMIKKNIDLEKKAMQQLQGGGQQQLRHQNQQQGGGNYQQQLQMQQQYEQQQQLQYQNEVDLAIQASLQQQNNVDPQMQEIEKAMALSKLEHDQNKAKGQLTEEEELAQVIALSKQAQEEEIKRQQETFNMYGNKNNNQYQQQKQQMQKPNYISNIKPNYNNSILNSNQDNNQINNNNNQIQQGNDDNLLSLSDDDGANDLLQSQALGQNDFDQMKQQNQQQILSNNFVQPQEESIGVQQNAQQPQEQPVKAQTESLQEKKERLKKQRELLLAKKKMQRGEQVEEFKQQENK